MNDINEVYEKYSKVNQYKNVGLTDFYKIENNTKYYFLPDWISKKKENHWVASFRLKRWLNDDVDKQIYYDLVHLGLTSVNDRPRCEFCNKESRFDITRGGYLGFCPDHMIKHRSKLVSEKLKGRPLSEENRKKLSLAKKGKKLTEEQRLKRPRGYHFHLSQEAKDKISKSKKGKVMSRAYYKSGTYESPKCKEKILYLSSYERDFLTICDYSKFIVSIEIPDPIRYNYSGGSHNYYPDFIITTDSGLKIMVEVKAKNLINNDKVIAKRLAGKKWCRENNIKYVTLTERDLYINVKYKKQINKNLYIYKYVV